MCVLYEATMKYGVHKLKVYIFKYVAQFRKYNVMDFTLHAYLHLVDTFKGSAKLFQSKQHAPPSLHM